MCPALQQRCYCAHPGGGLRNCGKSDWHPGTSMAGLGRRQESWPAPRPHTHSTPLPAIHTICHPLSTSQAEGAKLQPRLTFTCQHHATHEKYQSESWMMLAFKELTEKWAHKGHQSSLGEATCSTRENWLDKIWKRDFQTKRRCWLSLSY